MGVFEACVATMLCAKLFHSGDAKGLGRTMIETLFVLDAESRLWRRPDLAFVSFQRWSKNSKMPRTEAWDVVPDLAVEVINRSITDEKILGKIGEYFQAGVLLVWVIYPSEEQMYVYHSPTQAKILTLQDEIDGENIVPEFRMPLAKLFEVS